MKYTSIKVAKFIRRPNRFIAHVIVDNDEEIVHVKNTGRCKEILQEGTMVILEEGYAGFIFFLIHKMNGVKYFTPYELRDPEFAKALKLASEKGVKILAYDSIVYEDEIIIGAPVRGPFFILAHE